MDHFLFVVSHPSLVAEVPTAGEPLGCGHHVFQLAHLNDGAHPGDVVVQEVAVEEPEAWEQNNGMVLVVGMTNLVKFLLWE